MKKKGRENLTNELRPGLAYEEICSQKHNFRVELKELIVIPNIAARLKVPTKRQMGTTYAIVWP